MRQRLVMWVPFIIAASVGAWLALSFGGGASAGGLEDPGDLVRWGTPLVKMVVSLSGALVIGALGVLLFVLPPGEPAQRVQTVALGAGVVWTLSIVVYTLLTYFTVIGTPPAFDGGFDENFGFFVLTTELGQQLMFATGMAATATTMLAIARRFFWLAAAFLVAVASAWPFAEMSHSGATANHGIAVNALVLHIVFVSLWTGGLVATIVAMSAGANRSDALRRYSSIALLSISIVAITGVSSAFIRIGTLDNLMTEYGILVLLKALGVAVLALLGVRWRWAIIPHLDSTRGVVGFALVETAILGVIIGLATGLARTEPRSTKFRPGR